MGFIEDEKIGGEEDAGGLAAGAHSGVEEGEKEAMIDNANMGGEEAGPGATIAAALIPAIFAIAGGGIRVDLVPDLRRGLGVEFLALAGGSIRGPCAEPFPFLLFVSGKEFGLLALEEAGESVFAEVIGLADEKGGLETGVGSEFRDGLEKASAEGKVFIQDLLLESDGVGGNDHGAIGIDAEKETGDEVGEAFSNPGTRFKEQRLVGEKGLGDMQGHLLLLGAILQAEDFLKESAPGEYTGHPLNELERGRVRFGLLVDDPDHLREGKQAEQYLRRATAVQSGSDLAEKLVNLE